MVAKPVTVGVVGVIVLASALVLNYFVLPGEESDTPSSVASVPAPSTPSPKPSEPASGSTAPAVAAGSSAQSPDAVVPKDSAAPQAKQEEVPGPSFDVVRVDPDGNTVIAGRGTPNTEIAIVDGDEELGRVTTDNRGEWVFIPPEKLTPGERVLALRELNEAGAESANAVVLVIPEKGKDIAGRPSSEPSVPLAMVVPKGDAAARKGGSARVLQAPAAGPLASTGSAAAREGTATTAAQPSTPGASGAASPTPAVAAGAGGAAASATGAVASAPAAAGEAPAAQAFPETPKDSSKSADVAVDVIDYDEKGEVVFSGRAEPGSKVEVFIDNRKVGDVAADTEGKWRMQPAESVPPGAYQLRVDKVAPTGVVEARVAFPFVRADPLTDLPDNRLVVIQPGNNLWRIATRVYGSGVRYVEIFDANRDQILDPDLIFPGQVFGLPRTN